MGYGQAGLLANAASPEDVADKIEFLGRDRGRYSQSAQRARTPHLDLRVGGRIARRFLVLAGEKGMGRG